MELHRFLGILRRGWWLIAAFAVVGLLGSGVAAALTPTQYAASTRLFVTIQTTANATAGDLVAGNSFAIQKVTSYVAVASSPLVLDPVISDRGLDTTAAALARDVTVTVTPNSAIIEISALADTAEQSAELTTAIASSFSTVVVDDIEAPADGTRSPVRVQVIQPAVAPSDPALPSVPLFLGVGLLIGLALGLAVVLILGYLDRRLRTRAEIESISPHPVLGSIPESGDLKRGLLLARDVPDGRAAESFRALRTNMQFVGFEGRARSIVFASSTAGEGTSTVVANVAASLAEAGSSVAVVDADLLSPSMGALFRIDDSRGLSDVINGRMRLDDALVPWGGGISVLPAGSAPSNPSGLLGSRAMSEILGALTAAFDYVIIDAPPVLPVSDAAVLSRMTSGAVLVIRAREVREEQVTAAMKDLESAGGSTIGVVVNRIASHGPDSDVTTRESGKRTDRSSSTATKPPHVQSSVTSKPSPGKRRAETERQGAKA